MSIRDQRPSARRAELSALLHVTGSLSIAGGKLSLVIHTENPGVARRVIALAHGMYDIQTEIRMARGHRLQKKSAYSVAITGAVVDILRDAGLLRGGGQKQIRLVRRIHKRLVRSEAGRRAFFRGAFLGAGSLSNPERGYHLEMVVEQEDFARDLCALLCGDGLMARVIQRKNHHVVYIKEGEHIANLLAMMGAHTAILNMENVRILKQVRNDVNRVINCETANLDKTLNAAYRQIENIRYIQETVGLDALPRPLREVARLRVENVDATLSELGAMMGGEVGRSGINHRLRRINQFAMELREERGEREC